jgi:hypothetical protein
MCCGDGEKRHKVFYFLSWQVIFFNKLALLPVRCYGFYDAVGLLTRFVSSGWLAYQGE